MIPNLLDSVIERCQPHLINTRDYLIMFCTGVIERLDAIRDAVQVDDTFTVRREFHGFAAAGVVTTTVEIPSNETWSLESLIARTIPAAASTLDIREQGGKLRFANDIGATGALTGIFPTLTFHGGTILTVTMAQPGEFHLTFRHVKAVPTRPAFAGFRNPATDGTEGELALHNDNRHEGAFTPHPPIMGPYSKDAQTGEPPFDD